MSFWKNNNIERVWANICKCEGKVFCTVTNVKYSYVVKNNYILVNNDPRRRITKSNLAKALEIENPTYTKIANEKIWGPSYVLGIIMDERIVSI